ncbi:hypothetical protein Bca52824_017905 [Brassica carinata]|uniref:Uncharacterized protein n=1 Tax=Brassica carinata TaxID=52824 RepID=A0A8X8AXY6_BRACI|nr:hypothetical protein Bca52824_017905 [Brassica carinata]
MSRTTDLECHGRTLTVGRPSSGLTSKRWTNCGNIIKLWHLQKAPATATTKVAKKAEWLK